MDYKTNIRKLKSIIQKSFFYTRSMFLMLFSKPIIVHGYFGCSGFKIINGNFGDDINIPLLEHLTGRRIILRDHIINGEKKEHLLPIGSLIDYYANQNSIIWGSGVIKGVDKLSLSPKKVCAVRGRLSYEYLITQGISCPEIFGDPALLLPLIYMPSGNKRYKVGFIPHVLDFDLPHVKLFRDAHPEILFIKFAGYSNWKDVIEQINSCECIVSSSLHGLIVSDAYKIPNVWVELSDRLLGGEFKFKDYFSGINREYYPPIDFKDEIKLTMAIDSISRYKLIQFNPVRLLRAFPYELTTRFEKMIKSNDYHNYTSL